MLKWFYKIWENLVKSQLQRNTGFLGFNTEAKRFWYPPFFAKLGSNCIVSNFCLWGIKKFHWIVHPIYCVIYCVNMKGTKIKREFRNTKKIFYSLDILYGLFLEKCFWNREYESFIHKSRVSRPLNISPRQNFLLHERPAINCIAIFDSSLNPFAIEGPDSDLWVASKMLNTPAAQ